MGTGEAGREAVYRKPMKKILIYNWVPFDETENKGGGVSVYTKNLIRHLIRRDDLEVYFLSSGRAYDIRQKGTFIEPSENIFGDKCCSFQIVNSPVLSSARLSFTSLWRENEDIILKQVVRQFFLEEGGFDIVHFQNLEGLSLGVLALKEEFPGTRFIYSLHNYYPFCPGVTLWKADSHNCREKRCGEGCIGCMPRDVHRWKVILNQWINYRKQRGEQVSPAWELVQRISEKACVVWDSRRGGKISVKKRKRLIKALRRFREGNVIYLNRYMDVILAVSRRTAEIAVCHGLEREKVVVSYIGTEAAENQKCASAYPSDGRILRICYLGYMRKEKGFHFLIEALEKMPVQTAERIDLTLAAKITDQTMKKRIAGLRDRLAGVTVYDGYTHDRLPQILENVQLGIIPPLWEDNLPQVAIEMRAQGIPLLVSDAGGAKELTLSKEFVFDAGDVDDFISRLSALAECPDKLADYWNGAPKLTTMEAHIRELAVYYEG